MSTMIAAVIPQWGDLMQNFPFEVDNRKSIGYWEVPWLGVRLGIIPLDFGFWVSTFCLLSLQTAINIAIALVTYFFILKIPSHEKKTISNENGETSGNNRNNFSRYMLGYGVLVPLLLVAPFMIGAYCKFHNLALLLCFCGAIPNLLTLRVIEAIHDLLPDFVLLSPPSQRRDAPKDEDRIPTSKEKAEQHRVQSIGYSTGTATKKEATTRSYSLPRLILYFSAPLQIQFDPKTGEPVLFTWPIFQQRFSRFLSVFAQTSLMYSLLLTHNYELFPSPRGCTLPMEATSSIASSLAKWLSYCFHWRNLVNGLLMASLTSLVLDGGASGLGLITSLISGYSLEPFSDAPLTKSTSPSDFWGNRWDRPVESSLRRGCYRPLRLIGGYSRGVAAFGTFVLSGLIHEYVLWMFTLRHGTPNYRRWHSEDIGDSANDQSSKDHIDFLQSYTQPAMGKQFIFFAWNAVVVLLERRVARHRLFSLMQERLPQPILTFLVLLTVLPIAHLFTDEYIRSGFYGDASWAFPIFLVLPM